MAQENRKKEDRIEKAVRLHDRAVELRSKGGYREAKKCSLEELKIFEEEMGRSNPDVANILNNLGGVYEELGEYNEALNALKRSVKIMEKFDEDDADLKRLRVQSISGFATIHRVMGKYDRAETL